MASSLAVSITSYIKAKLYRREKNQERGYGRVMAGYEDYVRTVGMIITWRQGGHHL